MLNNKLIKGFTEKWEKEHAADLAMARKRIKNKVWNNVTKEDMEFLALECGLSDSEIAAIYDIRPQSVTYKRKTKFGIDRNRECKNVYSKRLC